VSIHGCNTNKLVNEHPNLFSKSFTVNLADDWVDKCGLDAYTAANIV
jgi:hypothetical protein